MRESQYPKTKIMKLKIENYSVLFFFFCLIAFSGRAFSDEASVLLLIKASLVDISNSLEDWKSPERNLSGRHYCEWTGVSCNGEGIVDRLDLSRKNLTGKVPEDIQRLGGLNHLNLCCNAFSSSLPSFVGNLSSLRSLDVSQNLFAGAFPSGLGGASEIVYLNASSNDFSGPIPADFANLTSLEILDLRGSFFHGAIPRSLKNLKNLKFLGLSGNNLTEAIPPEIGELSSLETLILGYNEFDGGVPAEFGNLTALKYLDLSFGNLSNNIPAELGRLGNLETIYLYKNNFSGEIPPEIGDLTSLRLLDLSDNALSGKIPEEISNLKNLQLLNLMSNQLSGPVPSSIGGLPNLEVLALWNNSLSGGLPGDLGRNSPLQWLDVSSNSFSGEIPPALCEKGNLTKLILFNNAFTGPIPEGLSVCSSLVRVRIHNNLVSGPIPTGFGKLENLERLELSNNILTGQIPFDLSSSASLGYIDLASNRLRSSLPSAILSIPTLQSFIVSKNDLEGTIPGKFQDCPSLSVLDLSSNRFSGPIPESIASCERLVSLNLRNNRLTGEIPKQIATMSLLAILDLSNNSLTGKIPSNFGLSPALETLNVSYNRLEGPVPENGVLRTINPSDLVGNANLCGGLLVPCSQTSDRFSARSTNVHARHILASFLIGIASIIALLVAIFVVASLYKKWYSNGVCFWDGFRMSSGVGGEWPWRLMAFQRLSFTSSDILSCVKESNIIGIGATGTVFKAEISRSSSVVAVKKLWRLEADIESGNSNDLVGEVNLLGRLRHRNIVRLLGFLHNDSDVMILYEYMPNGNLGDALHGKLRSQGLLVDWVSRYNIAVGIAQGLSYLHHDCHPPVIHRDIKSNNILLDSNLDARIADFGLARIMVRKNETVSMVAGSYGYMAPELGYTMKIDEKVDIYSYGVVLLELLTGKRPLASEFGESVNIVEWIRKKIRESQLLEEALDPNVGNCKHVQEEMLLVLRIALLCTAKLPKDRPSMRDVTTMLAEAKPRRKSSSINIEANKENPVFNTSPVNGLL